LFQNALAITIVAIAAGTASTVAELLRPARPIAYRQVLLRDCAAFIVYIAVFYPVALELSTRCARHLPAFERYWHAPLALRMVTFYLAADLGSYVLHRSMHARWLWRIHKWHHAPPYMYWFAGVRATIVQQFLFNLPVAIAFPLIGPAPSWIGLFLALELIIRNDWMHLNVSWRSNWLEWILVTPRYHHIHHSAYPAHRGNYGSLFSIWDRLFGTRIDPDKVTPTEFGTGSVDNPVRVVLGV
jgi:sterol desaturase/sphingolipid hydroxylase (fatty acid hydroxylase superfamily)